MTIAESVADPRLVAAALRWWEDMGVDLLVEDEPQSWLGRAAVAEASAPATARMVEKPAPAALPATLDALVAWISSDADIPEAGPAARRVAPFGTPGARIAIVTDIPENGDAEAGALLSGEVGALFDRMLAAIGLDRTSVYCFPLCPGRPPTGRVSAEALARLADIAKHHLALAKPERVWLLGQATSRALLGMDASVLDKKGQNINHAHGTVPCIASLPPRMLLQSPQRKAAVWADMQALIGGM